MLQKLQMYTDHLESSTNSQVLIQQISKCLRLPGGSDGKESPAAQETMGREDPPEKGLATHSDILAWRIPWTEDPSGLQSVGSRRVRQD